jgi:cell division protein FtsB
MEREARLQKECEALEKTNRQLKRSNTDLQEKSAQQYVPTATPMLRNSCVD